ncbi:MAG: hypothetical protein Q9219_005411 [cf. Caloplaca sp. 3 TL-2023]
MVAGSKNNQIQQFNISTPDGESLYAWHVLPLNKYVANEIALVNDRTNPGTFTNGVAFDLLSADPTSRLFTETQVRYLKDGGQIHKVHVLAIDYRGYGYSTGSPDEQGLITDGVAAVRWAMDIAKVPPNRIALVGASLGTAVTTAVAEHLVRTSQIELAGIVLIAPFSDVETLLHTYSIGGIVPILSPLRPYAALQKLFLRYMRDTWTTLPRLANLVRKSQSTKLHLIHAKTDFGIPWKHTEALFVASANATSPSGLSVKQIDGVKFRQDLGEGGSIESWNAGGTKQISKHVVHYGGRSITASHRTQPLI